MNSSVFWALVRKDLYLMRALVVAIIVAGGIAFLLMGFGKIGFAVGGILFLTANVAGGIFIAMLSVLTERVKNVQLFALSLPISGAQYGRAKLLSTWLVYGIPWGVLTALAVLSFLLSPEADRGMVVYAVILQGFVLAIFSVMLATLFLVKSEPLSGIGILVVNICFSLFMVKVNQPEVIGLLRTDTIVWTPFARAMLAGEVLVMIASLVVVLIVTSRQRDHV
jgi:ABC-2 type transport system permease protein